MTDTIARQIGWIISQWGSSRFLQSAANPYDEMTAEELAEVIVGMIKTSPIAKLTPEMVEAGAKCLKSYTDAGSASSDIAERMFLLMIQAGPKGRAKLKEAKE